MEENRVLSQSHQRTDDTVENLLRPASLDDYVGQSAWKDNLRVFIQAARGRDEAMSHVLLDGPPGLGKTTLATLLARELGVSIRTVNGPMFERAGDLAAILCNLKPRDVLFIDEIHRINRKLEEHLYSAMEDFHLDIVVGQGPAARTMRVKVPPFTLVGATTRAGLITSPMLARFGIHHHFDFYTEEELALIIRRSAHLLNTPLDEDAAALLAHRCRGTPRVANRLLSRTRDFAQVLAGGVITKELVLDAMQRLGVDQNGLDNMDRKLLRCVVEVYSGGPVGLSALGASLGEEEDTLQDVYEPFLVREGYLARSPRGRVATPKTYDLLGLPQPAAGAAPAGLFES